MKLYSKYFIVLTAVVLIGCKSSLQNSFIKTSKQSEIVLKSIPKPFVVFVLESGDSLKFSKHDVQNLIKQHVDKEIKTWGYSSSPHITKIAEALGNLKADTLVYQNLSAVGIESISDNLDTWIARELLLEGKAEISLKDKQQQPARLKYIYTEDILSGQQGTFYSMDQKEIYRTIIALGE